MARFENRNPANKSGKRNGGMTSLEIRRGAFDEELKGKSNAGAYTRPGSNKK